MSKKKSNKVSEKSASAYTHDQEATQRPDVGVQPEFDARKAGGVPARYIPDFIAELDIGLNLIIETKRQYGDDSDIKAKATQRWVTAVNQDGNYGLWAYEVVKDPTDLPLLIDKYSAAKWDENATLEASGL